MLSCQQVPFLVRRLRLATGLVLISFVASHLLNHALGLVSLEAMEAGRLWFLWVWRNPVSTLLLYGALSIHFLLALWAIYQRKRLRDMPPGEAAQLVLGLSIVPLLAEHVIGNRVAAEFHDVVDSYAYVLLVLWYFVPAKGALQVAALVVAWVHGCFGLHYWLRLKPWYPAWQPLLYAGALLVPVLALLGFAEAGREVSRLASDPAWLRRALTEIGFPGAEAVRELERAKEWVYVVFAAFLAAAFAARAGREYLERRRGLVRITYPGGRQIEVATGLSVLEASRLHGIPHASVCGGRGRCSTCRVRVNQGLETLPPPSAGELAVLKRVSAAPNVRLACQIRPRQDLAVTPLLPPSASAKDGHRRPEHAQGKEKEIAILFADIRAFTRLSENKLPYDVVFILNRYFAAMGQEVVRAGGEIDKFIGDGVMALFGVDEDAGLGCWKALDAARGMSAALEALNRTLAHDLESPLRIGIGIHVGRAIVGEMGYARAVSLTAIGDAVNTASRLEALTKDFGVQLVVSEAVAARAGLDLSRFPERRVEIRGREEPLSIRVIERAADLPTG
ncbi:MAG: adenylate/guanylate cyclase domain-containing protein [Pseudomonadota bacterium]